MTSARCPACGAAVVEGAPWCTLCYADLRPKPAEATPAPAAPAGAAPAAGGRHRQGGRHAAAHAAPVSASTLPAAPVDLLDPHLDRPVLTHGDAVRSAAGWPCLTCGNLVALEEQSCPQCGAGFLAGADPTPAVALPGVGDMRSLTAGGKLGVIAIGAVGLMIVLLVLGAVVGQFV